MTPLAAASVAMAGIADEDLRQNAAVRALRVYSRRGAHADYVRLRKYSVIDDYRAENGRAGVTVRDALKHRRGHFDEKNIPARDTVRYLEARDLVHLVNKVAQGNKRHEIIVRFLSQGYQLGEIGVILGVSGSRVCQLISDLKKNIVDACVPSLL